ncbi:MAG: HD domain-containing protein [Chloroflexi bacterium]|nr:HD domain-containing protein [Chloroflexota bacterium]
MIFARTRYRVRQFLSALTANITDEEKVSIDSVLSPPEREVFYSMRRTFQSHGWSVFRTLIRRGHTDRDLLASALLHDVGKGNLGLFYRVMVVVLEAVYPSLLPGLAKNDSGWRQGFYVHLHHSELGAALAERQGLGPKVVSLIRHHQDRRADWPHLKDLRAADADN